MVATSHSGYGHYIPDKFLVVAVRVIRSRGADNLQNWLERQ
jgi:hypothetical protein